MKKKTIFTHVSAKAAQGIARIFDRASVYMYPIPYGKNFDKFTVVVVEDE